jgi:hypothetical protein
MLLEKFELDMQVIPHTGTHEDVVFTVRTPTFIYKLFINRQFHPELEEIIFLMEVTKWNKAR